MFISSSGFLGEKTFFHRTFAAILLVVGIFASSAYAGGSKDKAPEPTQSVQAALTSQTDNAAAPERLFAVTGDQYYRSPNHASIDAASLENQSAGLSPDWWVDAAFYHVWVKSFFDYDGDGVGDFRGITARLDYIKDTLGCDAIWLSPIFDCAGKGTAPSSNMHGYDTVDYYEVNDYFGNKEHLATLLSEAHKRGIKVIFDFVPNHTSNQHPWFIQSANFDPEKKDWYLWNDKKLPWNPMGNTNTWYRSDVRQAYYYGAFYSGMPDLNFRNREVREEMKNVARYWLDFGFDGLRIDAVRYLLEEGNGVAGTVDTKATHEFWEELRAEVVDKYAALGHPKFMVGEAWISGDRGRLASYFGNAEKPQFHMLFDFDFTGKVASAVKAGNKGLFDGGYAAETGRHAVFLSNHDNLSNRPGSVYTNPAQLRAATALSLLMPATPFVYYANETGQSDQGGSAGQDIRLRYPLDWIRVAAQENDPASLLTLHRDLLALRAKHSAIRRGTWKRLELGAGNEVAAWSLEYEGERMVCVFNFGSSGLDSVPALVAAATGTPASDGSPAGVAKLYDGSGGDGSTLAQYGFAVYGVSR